MLGRLRLGQLPRRRLRRGPAIAALVAVTALVGLVVAAVPSTSSASPNPAAVSAASVLAATATGDGTASGAPGTAVPSPPGSPTQTDRAEVTGAGIGPVGAGTATPSTTAPAGSMAPTGTTAPAGTPTPAEMTVPADRAAAASPAADPVLRLPSGRTYELHTEVRLSPQFRGTARPLVIMLHGLRNTAETLRQATGADAFADGHGFAVAYGIGVHEAWNAGGCCGGAATDDVAYVRQIVADVARYTPVDRDRVYVWGFSNGGMLAARIACDAPDLVAAVGMVGGQALVSCPTVPVRMLHIHGTADATVPWRGGWSDYLSMNLPDGETEATHFAPGSDIRHTLWEGGHTWPWWGVGALWDFSVPASRATSVASVATTASVAGPVAGATPVSGPEAEPSGTTPTSGAALAAGTAPAAVGAASPAAAAAVQESVGTPAATDDLP
ncbi:PHB depolymerase family esterase [Frankia sp. AgB32]|uniref:alpha/beta hydrolase family esterase n=1 Tax=Frankia sp. AgB32 TaxID=631119 RepID=UPI00200FB9C6|nr:PHB depolymerase family esterase [Frankia sp. AgB32]MCK9895529.1 poly(3-hydroxybutyrate) depolymerase [Frankia sp. AgB32]